jgi:glycosyltransferase involved in cell wall biosynthesis
LRILMLAPPENVRGPVPRIAALLVAALRESGCTVVQEAWGRATDEEGAARKLPRLVHDIRRVRRRLAADPVDVMVVHTSHEWRSLLRDVPLLLAVRRRAARIAVQFHGGRSNALVGPGNRAFKLASRVLLRSCDGLLLLSREEAREFRTFDRRGEFRTVSNPYSPALRRQGHRRGDRPTLLFVSRLIQEKGILDVVEALAIVRERVPAHLTVVGTGPDSPAVEERISALGLSEAATVAGYLSPSSVGELYRTADVFVLPTYWIEGFPTVIAEAMDAGLPIITTRTRGMADHLEDGVNALFVPRQDPRALASAVEKLLADQAARARMGEANRASVEKFAPKRVAADYIQALEAVMASTTERAR